MGGQIIDASIVPVPGQRNKREENATIKAGDTPEVWKEKPARLRRKDCDARWTGKTAKAITAYPSGQAAFLRSWGFQFHGISSSMGLICDQQCVPAPM